MSAYPVMLDGVAIRALVVGGGAVALRRVRALLACGASVRVVAPAPCEALRALVAAAPDLCLAEREYESADLAQATLVIAATDVPRVNARVAADARAAGLLVNVADAPALGTMVLPAVHRSGHLTIAVSAGGVPAAAARIRDRIAERMDGRYGAAIALACEVRSRHLRAGLRERWRAISARALDEHFCDRVESGAFASVLADAEEARCQ